MEAKEIIRNIQSDIKDVPLWLKYLVAIATIFGTLFGGWGLLVVLNTTSNKIIDNPIFNATSTINISDVLSKAVALDTVLERQDFLTKYIGSSVRGEGVVKEVSRVGDGFLIDIRVNEQKLTCPQAKSGENERLLPLLQGKKINFIGTFTYRQVFEHGLEIGDCLLLK
ncbi:MAG: hypothetical protein HYY10_00015 [Candidatus Liptonbacteria bacterium]|nr:hypothetical protein [Candidatus Liptonbacteria bacterium]